MTSRPTLSARDPVAPDRADAGERRDLVIEASGLRKTYRKRGRKAKAVEELANAIISTKGVKHGKLTVTSAGGDI